MRWQRRRQSDNVEDRRGAPRAAKGAAAVGGGGLVLVILAMLFGIDPGQLLGLRDVFGGGQRPGEDVAAAADPGEAQLAAFVKVVLADTEDVWHELLPTLGARYREPTLVLFRDAVESACGFQQAAVGPFYCPADQKVYLDLGFFAELRDRLDAPGDFAQAYVIAHEVGHHVQNLLGTSRMVHARQQRASQEEANDLSVRLELQADFYAGVWAHHAQKLKDILDAGDIDEALACAAAIGDDRLQRRARGRITPESFTHGTSEQRVRWFKLGFTTGDLAKGDTFSAEKP